jgi:hypothetical protein
MAELKNRIAIVTGSEPGSQGRAEPKARAPMVC